MGMLNIMFYFDQINDNRIKRSAKKMFQLKGPFKVVWKKDEEILGRSLSYFFIEENYNL